MKFYIKEWPDDTATLMTEHGRVIWTFSNAADAVEGCLEWTGREDEIAELEPREIANRLQTAA